MASDRDLSALVLTHGKAGDLGQMMSLAKAIGGGVEVVRIEDPDDVRANRAVLGRKIGAMAGDVVILTAERRLSRTALHARDDNGPRTRVVAINRPGYRSARFDLILTSPQYKLSGFSNVVELPLTLNTLDRDGMREAAAGVAPAIRGLSRPVTAVLVGGQTKVERLGVAEIRALIGLSLTEAETNDGSVLFVTSPRTPGPVARALAAQARGRAKAFLWGEAPRATYAGVLELADRFVVTSDSASMATEAILTGKPTSIFHLPARRSARETARGVALRLIGAIPGYGRALVNDAFEPRADRRRFFRPLEASGVVRRYDERTPFLWAPVPIDSPLAMAAAKVRELFQPRGG